MFRPAVLLAVLLALPLAADTPSPAPAAPPRPSAPPKPAPANDEKKLDEFVPSEHVPAGVAVDFPNDI